jgi:FecR protein
VRGNESMLVSPNSLVGIPSANTDGMATTIIQRAGTILLEVEKRNVKHFEVETPYLAAVVKGTRFRVTVDKDDAHVDVLRGQVEVSDYKSGQYALIVEGQTAKVSTQGPFGLSLSGSGTLSHIQQGTPRSSALRPAPATDEELSAPAKPEKQIQAASPQGNGQIIAASSERNAGNPKLWAANGAADGGDNSSADSGWPRNNEIVAALSVPFGVGLFVAVAVTTYRQRRKNKSNDNRPTDR